MSIVERVLAVAVLAWCAVIGGAAAQTDPSKPPETAASPPPAPAAPASSPAAPAAPPPAASASPAPAPVAPSATAGETVTGAAAWERLKGNTITGKVSGQVFVEYFDPAGGVRYVDKDGLSTGTWAVQNTKVCFDFPDDDDRSCSTFTVSGMTGTAVDDDAMTTKFEIMPGNSNGL